MGAGNYNLLIEQGATYDLNLTWKTSDDVLIDLTGYTAKMEIRASAESAPIITLTNGSGITLGGVLGTIDIQITATETGAFTAGEYLYDLELTSGATVTRLIEGKADVKEQITQ